MDQYIYIIYIQGGPSQADVWIQSVDDEDDIFGMLEVRSFNIIWQYFKVYDPSVSFNTPPKRFRVSNFIRIESKLHRIISHSRPPTWIVKEKMKTWGKRKTCLWGTTTKYPTWGEKLDNYIYRIYVIDDLRTKKNCALQDLKCNVNYNAMETKRQ